MTATMERPATTRRAPAPGRRRARSGPRFGRMVTNALLAVFVIYTAAPLLWLVIAATKDGGDLFVHPGFELGDFNLFSNIHKLFTWDGGIYGRWLANTLLYTVVGSTAGTMVCVMAGYAFDKYHFPGKERLFGVVLVGVLVPAVATALPIYLLFAKIGLVNTYWSVLLPSLVNPYGVYLARVFSEGYVPDQVLEAARMDGASELTLFRRVSLPMLTPGFVTIFLFSFTASWNNFFMPLVMLSDHTLYPVNLGLYTWNSTATIETVYYSLTVTGALIAVIPLIIAFISLQRFWKSGLTAGAVK